jgi:integrase
MPKLTKRNVDAVQAEGRETVLWDSQIPAFGLRAKPSGIKSFFVQYRNTSGRSRRITVGRFGVITVEQARLAAKATLAQVALGSDPAETRARQRNAITVAELCNDYLGKAERGLLITRRGKTTKASTLYTDRGRIERHIKPLLGTRPVTDVTAADVRAFLRDVIGGKTKADIKTKKRGRAIVTGGKGTAARTVGLLGGIFSFAADEGYRVDNPVHGVNRPADEHRHVYIDQSVYGRIGSAIAESEHAGESWQAIYLIRAIALTGARRGEIINLKRSEIDLDAQVLRLGDTKTGRSIRPIGKKAVHVFKVAMRRTVGEYVFSSMRSPEKPFSGLPKAWNRIIRTKLENLTPHSLRHGFASSAEQLGLSIPTIRALLGHASSGVTESYIHKPDAALISAANTLSAWIHDALNSIGEKHANRKP